MAERLRIAAVTGGRADWGLLSTALLALRTRPGFEIVLVVTGQHLAPGEEASLAAIEADGFSTAERVTIMGDDSVEGVTRSACICVQGIGACVGRLKPDLMMILGDRYEILAAAMAALIARVPVAHLCGGDITEGAMDDAIRHAITKLSHLHFVTNAEARRRVIQLGEQPSRVHCVGSPGLDRIRTAKIMPREAFFATVAFAPRRRNVLVTYHPATLNADTLGECAEMLAALDSLGPEIGILFTGANADPGARGVDKLIGEFVGVHANARALRTLGSEHYFAALKHMDAVVGNSSSGLYEAPTFATPTVNIGDRQKGRLRARSVIDCAGERGQIRAAIEQAFALDCRGVVNPYGDGHASDRICAILEEIGPASQLLRKRFYDIALGQCL